jgi:uncharacterized protein (TIGR03435 family)
MSMQSLVAIRIAVLGFVGLVVPQSQTVDDFDLAVIRANSSGSPNTQITLPAGGRLVVVNASLRTLIRNAYSVLPFQLEGGPKWQDDARFDLNARNESGQELTFDTFKLPLKKLLADRFHLKTHWETREMPAYVLTVDKGGPKFQAHADAPGHGMNTRKSATEAQMKGTDVEMTELADNLGNQLGRLVVDETGLHGRYDFVFKWDAGQMADSTEPSLFTAMREQLGLRLEPKKAPVQVLVIDSAEKPTDN